VELVSGVSCDGKGVSDGEGRTHVVLCVEEGMHLEGCSRRRACRGEVDDVDLWVGFATMSRLRWPRCESDGSGCKSMDFLRVKDEPHCELGLANGKLGIRSTRGLTGGLRSRNLEGEGCSLLSLGDMAKMARIFWSRSYREMSQVQGEHIAEFHAQLHSGEYSLRVHTASGNILLEWQVPSIG
jgi:hypothetical protein